MEVLRKKYPNGSEYLEFSISGEFLGTAIVSNGGYLVSGKRIARPTLKEAALQMVDSRIRLLKKEIDKLKNLASLI